VPIELLVIADILEPFENSLDVNARKTLSTVISYSYLTQVWILRIQNT